MTAQTAPIREAIDGLRLSLLSDNYTHAFHTALKVVLDAAQSYIGLLDEFYDPHDDLIALRDFIDQRESLEFPDIGEVSNQLAAIIAKLTVLKP